MSRIFTGVQGHPRAVPPEREDSVLDPPEGHPLSPRGARGDPSVRATMVLAVVIAACVLALLLVAIF
jgi:hypothetical protein